MGPRLCRGTLEYHSSESMTLISWPHKNPAGRQCLEGSFAGEVASKIVTEAYKGWLIPDGNRDGRANAEASLTARHTSRADAKAGVSDPRFGSGCRTGLTDKSYPGDNRLIGPESPYRRPGLAPR